MSSFLPTEDGILCPDSALSFLDSLHTDEEYVVDNESEHVDELIQAASDPKAFFDNWVMTYDPRLPKSFIPMKLFPIQSAFIDWLCEREKNSEDGLVEKSRDMGVTWLCAGFLVHHWLFRPGFKGSIGSRKEKLVDTIGDPDSIFEKMRIILRNLPIWMLPAGFTWKQHDNFCKLLNPANGASITGEAGDDIGRGGRNTMYFVDEAAFIERPQLIDRSLSANTKCRIDVSTPNGNGNPFATKRFAGNVKVFTLHWKQDNRKNAWELVRLSDGETLDFGLGGTPEPETIPDGCIVRYPWYEAEKRRLQDPVVIAQELDIDYTASIDGIVIPSAWVRCAVDLNKRIKMPMSYDTVAGFDVADGGKNSSILTIRRGPIIVAAYERKEGGTTDTAFWALNKALEMGAKTLNFDAPGVGAGPAGTYKARARVKPLGLQTNAINTGSGATLARWPSGKTSKEMFRNLRAELWWIVRRRFEKTYEYVTQGIEHPTDELISIPDIPALIQELSNVLYYTDDTGKIHIESKKEMTKRGVQSPDWADALMLCFAPKKRVVKIAAGGARKSYTLR